MCLTKEVIEKNYTNYKGVLDSVLGEEVTNEIINSVGGEDVVKNASFSNLRESGSAYEGSLVRNSLRLAKIAVGINKQFPENKQLPNETIYKVSLLSHVSKVLLYEKNNNAWEVENRGMIYKYVNLPGAIRTGERSILIATNAGAKFTAEEFEAMRSYDKADDNDAFAKYFTSQLALIMRQANELLAFMDRQNVQK